MFLRQLRPYYGAESALTMRQYGAWPPVKASVKISPLNRQPWTSAIGDLWVGTKINFSSQADQKGAAFALRGLVKVPTGSKSDGTTTGKLDFAVDAIASREAGDIVDLSAYAGYIVRGNPSGYKLTNGIRWGLGMGLPTSRPHGLSATAELFGEEIGRAHV